MPYRRHFVGVVSVCISTVVGSVVGLAWAFTISLSMTEGGYRAVPASQWWLIRGQIVGALLAPLVVLLAAAVALAARPIRAYVAAWAVGLGVIAAASLLLYTIGAI